jgi:hypothetical protein
MVRYISVIFLLLSFVIPVAPAGNRPTQAPSTPTDTFYQYLPLIDNHAIIEAVKTVQGVFEGYPSDYYFYGYVRNLTTVPLYHVIIDIEVTIWPYEGPLLDPYTEIVHLTPAFTITLPGQVNPFFYELQLGKASASIGPIVQVSASYWAGEDGYTPLTITGYAYEDLTVTGTVRNDSSQPLHHTRVVGYEPYLCRWREAVLGADELLPGQETSFIITYYSSYCLYIKRMPLTLNITATNWTKGIHSFLEGMETTSLLLRS